MPEVKDPRIKLFGRNIHSHTQIPAAAQFAMGPSYGDGGRENNLGEEEKVVKRPDKIEACPRCHSLDTKFCYFNNYNINQPRHFCRNCKRYWTAGGTIRSVPVGAGRRKNKLPSSQTRGLPVTGSDNPNSVKNQHLSSAGLPATSESMTSSLNLRDPTISVKTGSTGNDGDEPSLSGCSSASTTVHENESPENVKEQAASMEHPMQCYPWNPMIPGITIPFIPASYWGYMPSWDCRNWNTPLAATSSTSNSCSGNDSPTLGKHSRDASVEEKTEQSLWVPKTLRIEDMDEAAKRSLWDTLGIKKGDMFRAFQSKPDTNGDAKQLLQANTDAAFDIL